MNAPSRYEFSDYIATALARDPVLASEIHGAIERGLTAALLESRTRACDFESALALYIRKDHAREEYARNMVNKWTNKCSLNWEWWK